MMNRDRDTSISAADQIVGEYMIYRGFTQSFRSFEHEKAKDKTKHFEVTRIVEAVFIYLNGYEIEQFVSLWDFLSKRFFFHLDGEHLGYSVSLKAELLKYYLVHAFKSNRKEKVTEFFSMYSHEILAESGDQIAGNLRSWFVLPYMEEPDKDIEFSVYFTSKWSDTLKTTIGNFLSIVVASAPPPKLLLLEKWFHSDAQAEMRSQLNISSRKVDALLNKLEKAEERISNLRGVVKDLVLQVQKLSVSGSSSTTSARQHGQSAALFETDEEYDYKRDKAKSMGQIVVKSAVDCVHKASHIAAMSREVRLREMLGDSSTLFLPKSNNSINNNSTNTSGHGSHSNASQVSATNSSAMDESTHKQSSSVAEMESNLIASINQWLKVLSV